MPRRTHGRHAPRPYDSQPDWTWLEDELHRYQAERTTRR